MVDQFLHIGSIAPIGGGGLNANDLGPTNREGLISFMMDDFGFRAFQYVRNWNGSDLVQGDLQSKIADLDITDLDSGTTTSATKTSGFTANKHNGMLLVVNDNDDAAGGEPEGECSIITAGNTADKVDVDADRPFTVALAANDDVSVFSIWHCDDSADSDPAADVMGIVIAEDGMTDQYYGWLQIYGLCPKAKHSAADVADKAEIVAGAAVVADAGSDGQELIIGYQIGTFTATSHDTSMAPVFLQLLGMIQRTAAP